MKLSSSTRIIGYDGTRAGLGQALVDRCMQRNIHHDVKDVKEERGTIELLLKGEWRLAKFEAENGWLKKIEILEK